MYRNDETLIRLHNEQYKQQSDSSGQQLKELQEKAYELGKQRGLAMCLALIDKKLVQPPQSNI